MKKSGLVVLAIIIIDLYLYYNYPSLPLLVHAALVLVGVVLGISFLRKDEGHIVEGEHDV